MSPITEAASVLLARGPGSPELFVVRRSEQLRFFGGYVAFPGGKVSAGDGDVPCLPARPDVRRAAAARELFEETGVLVARRPDGSFPEPGPDWPALRRDLHDDRVSFPVLLGRLGLCLRADDWAEVGNLVTPDFSPFRFDTSFFVTHLPTGQRPEVWPGELDHGEWTTADDLLRRWEAGDGLVSPPTVSLLGAVRGRPVDEAPARVRPLLDALAAGAIPPIDFAPKVRLIPLRTIGLPPSTHTNAYLVGAGPVYLIDPGPATTDEQQKLFDVLDAEAEAGRRPSAVVLTHHHPDHVGAANVCCRRYGVPIWAHPLTARALTGRIEVHREILDGDRLDLGPCPAGGAWHLEAVHTPGHAAGHLAFHEARYRLLFAGDMVSTVSSVVIAPPDGDLTLYLDSLRRLQQVPCRLLLPAHGSPSARPAQTLRECLEHRAKREEQLLAALGPSPRSVSELAADLYKGLPAELVRFAEMQLLAGLRKLELEGRAEQAAPGWRVRG